MSALIPASSNNSARQKTMQTTTPQLEYPPQISWPLQTSSCEAKPITPPQGVKDSGLYWCIVDYDHRPFSITCGYRMKKLIKLESFELYSRTDEIKDALDQFHAAGFCHGDFSPSNIMKDESDQIILIDLSFAGQLGSALPSFFPTWHSSAGIYGIGSDLEAFRRYTVPM